MGRKYKYGGMESTAISASGKNGVLIRSLDTFFFRVYNADHTFTDYEIKPICLIVNEVRSQHSTDHEVKILGYVSIIDLVDIFEEDNMVDRGIFDLRGKVALVTGASRGIGRAIATVLAEYGADVACVGRDMKACEITLGQVRAQGRKALPVKTEMRSEEDIKKMVEDTIKEFGKIDILFNNAGGGSGHGKIHEIATDDWDYTINANLRGTFLCMKYTIPYMLENKGGSIINISSVAGIRAEVPEIGSAAYGAAKAGINNLTKAAAMHYAKDNIRINAIAPGMHRSEIGRTGLTEEQNKERDKFLDEYCAEWIPMGRLAEAEELSGLVLLLASDASSYITGQIICEDGGKTARQ